MPGSNRLQADLSGRFSGSIPPGKTVPHANLFLLRHGQIEGHDIRRFIGQSDIPLDATGRQQAQAWQRPLASIPFGQIYTSALDRCRETVALACPDRNPIVDHRLNEIHLGNWDGQAFEQIKRSHPDLFEQRGRDIYGFRPPNGESFEDLFNRVAPFFDALPQTAPALVVTHAGVIRTMLCFWAGEKMVNLLNVKTRYGQLFVLGAM